MPQVCASPVRSCWNRTSVATRTGSVRTSMSAVPSWPSELAPQHHARPVVSSAHECFRPASSNATGLRISTCTGEPRRVREPSPTWPLSLPPQQYAFPSLATKQVCVPPGCRALTVRRTGASEEISASVEDVVLGGDAATGVALGATGGSAAADATSGRDEDEAAARPDSASVWLETGVPGASTAPTSSGTSTEAG